MYVASFVVYREDFVASSSVDMDRIEYFRLLLCHWSLLIVRWVYVNCGGNILICQYIFFKTDILLCWNRGENNSLLDSGFFCYLSGEVLILTWGCTKLPTCLILHMSQCLRIHSLNWFSQKCLVLKCALFATTKATKKKQPKNTTVNVENNYWPDIYTWI